MARARRFVKLRSRIWRTGAISTGIIMAVNISIQLAAKEASRLNANRRCRELEKEVALSVGAEQRSGTAMPRDVDRLVAKVAAEEPSGIAIVPGPTTRIVHAAPVINSRGTVILNRSRAAGVIGVALVSDLGERC